MAVGRAGDEQTELHTRGLAGEEAERGVTLQHRIERRREELHLEVVVHQGELRAAVIFGGPRSVGERPSESFRAAGKIEVYEVHAESHEARLVVERGSRRRRRA